MTPATMSIVGGISKAGGSMAAGCMLCAARHLAQPRKTAAIHNKFYVDDLTRRWYAEAKVNHTERAAQWNDAPRVYEHFPRIAYDLGLDTIQNQFRDTDLYTRRPWMEVVVTKRTCMHPELESPPITETFRTCPRRQMSLFTGWSPSFEGGRACDACDDSEPTLNCGFADANPQPPAIKPMPQLPTMAVSAGQRAVAPAPQVPTATSKGVRAAGVGNGPPFGSAVQPSATSAEENGCPNGLFCPMRLRACFANRSVYFGGNSIARGWYSALFQLLANAISTSGDEWTAERVQKNVTQKCGRGTLGRPEQPIACKVSVGDTTLHFGWMLRTLSPPRFYHALQRRHFDALVLQTGSDDVWRYASNITDRTSTAEMVHWRERETAEAPLLAQELRRAFGGANSREQLLYWRTSTPVCEPLQCKGSCSSHGLSARDTNAAFSESNSLLTAHLCHFQKSSNDGRQEPPPMRILDAYAWMGSEGSCAHYDDRVHHLKLWTHVRTRRPTSAERRDPIQRATGTCACAGRWHQSWPLQPSRKPHGQLLLRRRCQAKACES